MSFERFHGDTEFERHTADWAGARRIALVSLVLAAVSVGCATRHSNAPPPPRAKAFETYRVGAPDVLTISILPDPTIEREVVVRPDGMISIDLVGDVPAGGRIVEEIAQDIQKRIARYKRGAVVTVAVRRAASTSVTLLGEMAGNRALPLLKETRVAEAIGLAGGFNNFANRDGIKVIRHVSGETIVFNIDMDAILAGDLRTNIMLAGGDIIYCPPTVWARIGHAINALLYPFQPFLGVGTSLAGSALSNVIFN